MQQDPRSPRTIYWQGYRSVDAGRTWHFWTTGSAIAFDPFRPRTVHVARGDKLLVTRDGGASFQVVGHFGIEGDWELLNDGLPQPFGDGLLAQDPIHAQRFYFIPDSVGFYRADFTTGPR